MKVKNTEIKIIKGDITELAVDAIVNAANNKMLMGGGVAGAIKKKGGVQIEEEAVSKGPVEIGEALWTNAGKLKAKYVIHAATMGMDFQTDEHKIRASCANALKRADEIRIDSIAFCALGCGVGGFPLIASAKIMTQEVLKHVKFEKTALKEIVFCLYDDKAFEVFNLNAQGYISHIQDTLGDGPYVTVDAIIEMPEGIVLIERSNPPFGWALPGGFQEVDESLEEAGKRELYEETGIKGSALGRVGVYMQNSRTYGQVIMIGIEYKMLSKKIRVGDDATDAKFFPKKDIPGIPFTSQKKILKDYFNTFKK